MTYWQGVLGRLSIPGILLVALGAAIIIAVPWLSRTVFKREGDRAIIPLKVAGLAITVLGALILMDFIPNL